MEVIVLCGGLGTRLRGVVADCPKCLAPIAFPESLFRKGKKGGRCLSETDFPKTNNEDRCLSVPFLWYLLQWLGRYPVEHVVFSVGYLKEQVIGYVRGREWPFRCDFAEEDSPLGTGGGIRLSLSMCTSDHVVVINGDTFFPIDLSALPFAGDVTVALKPMRYFDRYGAVELSEEPEAVSRITAFCEKAPCAEGLINGGIYAIDRCRLDLSALPERFSFEKEVLEPGVAEGRIRGWVSDASFIDIGIPEDYARAQWLIPAWSAVQRASDAVMAASADTLFLDRDGVLNRHLPGDYVKSWDQWEWMPGIREALAAWAGKYPRIVLVTNQRGVGRGVMTDEDLAKIHTRMMEEVLACGGRIDLILVCTAVADADPRRKPNTGMFAEACALLPGIEAARSVMLGDSGSDERFASCCGMQFILLEGVS